MFLRTTGLIVGIVLWGTATAPAYTLQGTHLRESCQEATSPGGPTDRDRAFKAGWCLGYVLGKSEDGPLRGICVPPSVTAGHLARVVVRYLEVRPARLQASAGEVANEALLDAFPCTPAP